jgi:uncharacterized repeat protein (TIGR03803 family)
MTNLKQPCGWISKRRLGAAHAALALAAVLGLGMVATQPAQAQTFTVLYNFKGSPDGAYPYAGLLLDTAGNLYGTTTVGGSSNDGTVFKVDASGAETVLHSFSGADGIGPYAGVLMDAKGNLYGTTQNGGTGCSGTGCGTVFKLRPKAGGDWNETILHKFNGDPDGDYPFGLILDAKGNLYGATEIGGTTGIAGTVFKVSKAGKETVLHSFAGGPSDGASPYLASVVMDTKDNLYGDTFEGGDTQSGGGVVYKLSKGGELTVLHSFGNFPDGFEAMGTPAIDKQGNLYGTTYRGGSSGYGAVWKVSKTGKETVLHSFVGGAADGSWPEAGVTMDAQGNLYGVTTAGGTGTACGQSACGTVYKLTKNGTLTVLHSFTGADGDYPIGALIRDAQGNLYGTTVYGGSDGYGTVWKLTP